MMMMNTNDKTTARPTGTPRLSEMDKADGEIDAPLDSTMGLAKGATSFAIRPGG